MGGTVISAEDNPIKLLALENMLLRTQALASQTAAVTETLMQEIGKVETAMLETQAALIAIGDILIKNKLTTEKEIDAIAEKERQLLLKEHLDAAQAAGILTKEERAAYHVGEKKVAKEKAKKKATKKRPQKQK